MREEFVQQAVSFLKDPEVSEKSLAKKIAFLESKELSSEEIEEALKRSALEDSTATDGSAGSAGSSGSTGSTGAVPLRAAPYVAYARPAPQLPQRDWKDYFVMATVTAGVAYGIYEVAKRYVVPHILPPTPGELEADKQALEEEFARHEALLEQMQKDTEEIKESEQQRKKAYDDLIEEAQTIIRQVKTQNEQRGQDVFHLKQQLDSLKETLPKALAKHKDSQERALEDIQQELKSVKQLVSNRLKKGAASTSLPPIPPASSVPSFMKKKPVPATVADSSIGPNGRGSSESSAFNPNLSSGAGTGSGAVSESLTFGVPDALSNSVSNSVSNLDSARSSPGAESVSSALSSNDGSSDKPKSSIPAWQLAASRSHAATASEA